MRIKGPYVEPFYLPASLSYSYNTCTKLCVRRLCTKLCTKLYVRRLRTKLYTNFCAKLLYRASVVEPSYADPLYAEPSYAEPSCRASVAKLRAKLRAEFP